MEYGVRIKHLNDKLAQLTKTLDQKFTEDEKNMSDQSNAVAQLKKAREEIERKDKVLAELESSKEGFQRREEGYISVFGKYKIHIYKQQEQIKTLQNRCIEIESQLFRANFNNNNENIDEEGSHHNQSNHQAVPNTAAARLFKNSSNLSGSNHNLAGVDYGKKSSGSLNRKDQQQYIIKSKKAGANSRVPGLVSSQNNGVPVLALAQTPQGSENKNNEKLVKKPNVGPGDNPIVQSDDTSNKYT